MEDLLKINHLEVKYPIKDSFFNLMTGKNSNYVHAVNDISFAIGKSEILSFGRGEWDPAKPLPARQFLGLLKRTYKW